MFTDPSILNEIIKKKEFLENRRQTDIRMMISDLFDGALEREALEHSLRIEYPLVDNQDNKEKSSEEYIRLSKNLKKAWAYGREHFKLPFDKEFLITIAKYVEPDAIQGENGFRTMSVRPQNASTTPPYAAKLEPVVSKFFEDLGNLQKNCCDKQITDPEYIKKCIDIGSWIHLNLAYIHPFEDGNGRIARVIHNLYLRNLNALPPIIIHEGERKDYNTHLDSAISGFRDREGESDRSYSRQILSHGEKEYYDYMAGKLSVSLDRIL